MGDAASNYHIVRGTFWPDSTQAGGPLHSHDAGLKVLIWVTATGDDGVYRVPCTVGGSGLCLQHELLFIVTQAGLQDVFGCVKRRQEVREQRSRNL